MPSTGEARKILQTQGKWKPTRAGGLEWRI